MGNKQSFEESTKPVFSETTDKEMIRENKYLQEFESVLINTELDIETKQQTIKDRLIEIEKKISYMNPDIVSLYIRFFSRFVEYVMIDPTGIQKTTPEIKRMIGRTIILLQVKSNASVPQKASKTHDNSSNDRSLQILEIDNPNFDRARYSKFIPEESEPSEHKKEAISGIKDYEPAAAAAASASKSGRKIEREQVEREQAEKRKRRNRKSRNSKRAERERAERERAERERKMAHINSDHYPYIII